MITRRQLLALSAIPFAHTRAAHAQETKRFVAQAAKLTMYVPTHWSHAPLLPGGLLTIGAEDGFFLALPIDLYNVEDNGVARFLRISELPKESSIVTWRNQRSRRIAIPASPESRAATVLVTANPNPITLPTGRADYLLLYGDPEHFDSIASSIEFGLSGVSKVELANSILDIIETHSYFRDRIDWPSLRENAETVMVDEEIDELFRSTTLDALRNAGDAHSVLSMRLLGVTDQNKQIFVGNGPNYPTGQMLSGFGYLGFPHHNSLDINYPAQYASVGTRLRNWLASNNPKGWIIDLRYMLGGSVSPLLTPLYTFLPQGELFGFVDAYGNERWIERHGNSILPPSYIQASVDGIWIDERADLNPPIAVLCGSLSASAAEMGLLALRSRTNLRTFGGNTTGLTIGNESFPMYNSTMFYLATAAELDAAGRLYEGVIEPDVLDKRIADGTGVSEDELTTALDWLRQ